MKKILAVFLIAAFMAPVYGAPVAAVKAKAKIGAAEAMTKVPTKEATAKAELSFIDLPKTHWAYPYVMKMVEAGILSGYPDKTFRGQKTITRAEFSKVMTKSLNYIEEKSGVSIGGAPSTSEVFFKDLPHQHWAYSTVAELVNRYQILSGYPDKTFKPNKTINRYELATVLAKAIKKSYGAYGLAVPEVSTFEAVKFDDVKPTHWALMDINLLIELGILTKKTETKTETVKGKKVKKTMIVFEGDKPVDRYTASIAGSRLLDLLVENMPKKAAAGPVMQKMMMAGKPRAFWGGGYGQIQESSSATSNWLGFAVSALYGNSFKLWVLDADYELGGRYSYNQIVYITPGAGGGVAGGVADELRLDIDLNTVYPVVDFYGFEGKLLLGLKDINLSNQVAPTNFLALNAGVATIFPLFERKVLGRAFYSLIPGTATRNASILGQPNLLLNYELGTDVTLFDTLLMLGYTGETMFLNGGTYTRFYNMVFLRYNLF